MSHISGFWDFWKHVVVTFKQCFKRLPSRFVFFSWWISCEPLVAFGKITNGSVDDLQCLKKSMAVEIAMAISDWGQVAFSGIVGYISYIYICICIFYIYIYIHTYIHIISVISYPTSYPLWLLNPWENIARLIRGNSKWRIPHRSQLLLV